MKGVSSDPIVKEGLKIMQEMYEYVSVVGWTPSCLTGLPDVYCSCLHLGQQLVLHNDCHHQICTEQHNGLCWEPVCNVSVV